MELGHLNSLKRTRDRLDATPARVVKDPATVLTKLINYIVISIHS